MQQVESTLIGQRLRRWRGEQDLGGPEAAALVGLDWPTLRSFETGEVAPDEATSAALASAYGHEVDELVGAEGPADSPVAQRAPDDRPDHLQERSPYRPGPLPSVESIQGDWHLRPGDMIQRAALHNKYGGSGRAGIAASRKTHNVLIFSDPEGERPDGLYDRWDDRAGLFLAIGEGTKGDHTMDKGNQAILEHRTDRRALRLFEGTMGRVKYAGEFEIAKDQPYDVVEVAMADSDDKRSDFIFRLVPVKVH